MRPTWPAPVALIIAGVAYALLIPYLKHKKHPLQGQLRPARADRGPRKHPYGAPVHHSGPSMTQHTPYQPERATNV